MQRPEVLVFVGLQGAGKSTFFQQRFAATHVLVSRDLFRNNRKPTRRQNQLVGEALAAGRSVVVDNTNPSRAERAEIVAVARAHGAALIAYHFTADVESCLRRNAKREGKSRVPEVGILAAAKRLEPPGFDEGFERIFEVETLEGGFSIEERPRL